jgi:mannose-1-phosphate guanylyltransferase
MDLKDCSSNFKRAAIILAGGDGKRLGGLARKIAGFELSKQFCAVLGEMPLLEQTRRRISQCIHPELISFVLAKFGNTALQSRHRASNSLFILSTGGIDA